MKKLMFLTAFVLCALGTAHAQFYFRGGYTVGASPLKVLNSIVARYNDTRPWLSQTMAPIELLHGPAASIGSRMNALTMDLGWKRLRQKTTGSGIDSSGLLVSRDLIVRSDNFNYGLMADLFASEYFALGAGLTFDVNSLTVLTQVTGAEKRKLASAFGLGIGAQMSILVQAAGGVGIEVVPFVSYPFYKINLTPVSQELDAANAGNFTEDQMKQAFLNYGVAFYVRFGGFPQ